jgi:dephospho-CoA kinase
MMTARIIGIAGKAESGKDTAAGFITAVYPRYYYRRAFADAARPN